MSTAPTMQDLQEVVRQAVEDCEAGRLADARAGLELVDEAISDNHPYCMSFWTHAFFATLSLEVLIDNAEQKNSVGGQTDGAKQKASTTKETV